MYVCTNLRSMGNFIFTHVIRKIKFTYINGMYANVTHVKTEVHSKVLDVFRLFARGSQISQNPQRIKI